MLVERVVFDVVFDLMMVVLGIVVRVISLLQGNVHRVGVLFGVWSLELRVESLEGVTSGVRDPCDTCFGWMP